VQKSKYKSKYFSNNLQNVAAHLINNIIIPTMPGVTHLIPKEPGDMREQLEVRADSEVRQAATHALRGEAAHLPGL
jgi:hypothetical protein